MDIQVSLPLASGAGVVSFLSACILPVVPGYLAFVAALTLDELDGGTPAAARRAGVELAVLFMVGFGLVFLSLGLVPTPAGPPIARALPWLRRLGGLLVLTFGLRLLGTFRLAGLEVPVLPRPAVRSARRTGAVLVGGAFGAGWVPCIGPVLGSILLYVTFGETMARGIVLLLAYAMGLSVPFILVATGLTWPLAGSKAVLGRVRSLRAVSGAVLVVIGGALVTGYFTRLTAFLAGLGQLINLEL